MKKWGEQEESAKLLHGLHGPMFFFLKVNPNQKQGYKAYNYFSKASEASQEVQKPKGLNDANNNFGSEVGILLPPSPCHRSFNMIYGFTNQ